MKKIKIFLIIFSLCAFKCSDENSPVLENNGLVGKWKLTEYLADPGDGSGKWQPATDDYSHIIEFHADGQFTEIKGKAQSSIPLYKGYKLKGDNQIEMLRIDESIPSHIWTYSDMSSTELTLSYGCFEACSGRYVAVE